MSSAGVPRYTGMDFKLELVLLPVTDVDRAKAFYADQAGFAVHVDHRAGDQFRVVQMDPPGSACSIAFGIGISDVTPGSVHGLHLVVTDIEAARAELVGRGVEVSEIRHMTAAGWAPGAAGARQLRVVRRLQRPGRQHLGAAGGRSRPGREDGHTDVRIAQRTPSARAARALLPDACLVRRGGGRRAGDVPARVAQPGDFDGSSLLRAWLYRIATNVCLDLLRQTSRRGRPCAHWPRCRGCSRIRIGCSTRSPRATTSRMRSSSTARPSSWRFSPRCRSCRLVSARR